MVEEVLVVVLGEEDMLIQQIHNLITQEPFLPLLLLQLMLLTLHLLLQLPYHLRQPKPLIPLILIKNQQPPDRLPSPLLNRGLLELLIKEKTEIANRRSVILSVLLVKSQFVV